jgi:hypothetical protein
METILGKRGVCVSRRNTKWMCGKMSVCQKSVFVQPHVHEELKKRAAELRLSMGTVIERLLGVDIPLLKRSDSIRRVSGAQCGAGVAQDEKEGGGGR